MIDHCKDHPGCGCRVSCQKSGTERSLGERVDDLLWLVALDADATLMRNPIDRFIARRRLRKRLALLYPLELQRQEQEAEHAN